MGSQAIGKRGFLGIISLSCLVSFLNANAETSDEAKELRFHRIYKKYNEMPLEDSTWDKTVGARKAEIFKLQKGDTLWSVSQTLFGDPNFWPKIWGVNTDLILNPHEIGANSQIRFYPGTKIDAPVVALNEKEKTLTDKNQHSSNSNVVPDSISESDKEFSELKDVKPKKKRTPLVEVLPDSLPDKKYSLPKVKNRMDLNFAPRVKTEMVNLELSHFIVDEAPTSLGEVVGTEMELNSASAFQYIFVKIPTGQSGHFLILKNLGKLKNKFGEKFKAHQIEVQGEIEVKDLVNSKENIYKALITKSINPVTVGSFLVIGGIPIYSTEIGVVSNKSIQAKIIGGAGEDYRVANPTQSLVFIEAGKEQGLEVGDIFEISSVPKNHFEKPIIEHDSPSGLVKIVQVDGNHSTGYILKSIKPIISGDYVTAKTGSAGKLFNVTPAKSENIKDESTSDNLEKSPEEELNL